MRVCVQLRGRRGDATRRTELVKEPSEIVADKQISGCVKGKANWPNAVGPAIQESGSEAGYCVATGSRCLAGADHRRRQPKHKKECPCFHRFLQTQSDQIN